MSNYLRFVLVHNTGKTKVYSVDSVSQGGRLGVIRWFGRWRQYTLEPEPDTVWNKDCLREVAGFVDALMQERRAVAQAGQAKLEGV